MWKCRHKQTNEVVVLNEQKEFDLDKRVCSITNKVVVVKPVIIKTSLCRLFNAYFGIDCITHRVYSLNDLTGYYLR